ncbi:MAG: hypothetical protein HYZ65_02860 [Burkholderiales bacterium]|nr:hypothetical protein [Burkholderiales bacterium]
MKTALKTTLKNSLILSGALLMAVGAMSEAYQQQPALQHSATQTVTIAASRMSDAQKLAYDQARLPVQTVLISAKRLSAEQKLALDKEDFQQQQKLAKGNAGAVQFRG